MIKIIVIGLILLPLIVQADQGQIADYRAARNIFWKQLYPKGYTLYCDQQFVGRKKTINGLPINVEHVFAASWMTRAIGCGTRKQCRANSARFNRAEADLHNLYPSLAKTNSSRSNLIFGEINGERHKFQCDFERTKYLVEPRDNARGEIARSVLYMSHEYGFSIPKKMRELMLKWHKLDSPSEDEKRRNTIIKYLQGTTNPYIN